MHRDNNNPVVSVTVGYDVGSKDENKGNFGIAHLFEHMMFQGSANVAKNEHFGYVMKCGGSCNAFTMQDATVYFDTLPSNNLETALWLESDRMNSLDITHENLENQKSVVLEEKKQVFDNAPYGNLFNDIFSNLFAGSGYEHSVIGTEEDIRSFTVDGALEFHNKYYSPCNAILVVSGDIDCAEAEAMIRKYFSGLRTKCDIPRKENIISPLPENKVINRKDNIQLPAINVCYQIPKAGTREAYALEYFSEILGNSESSRLHRKFVYEKQMLKAIRLSNFTLRDAGALVIRAYVNPGFDVDKVRQEIMHEVDRFMDEGCTLEEFEKVRNGLEFGATAKHLKVQNIAVETIFNMIYFNDALRINEETERYLAVERAEVTETAQRYLDNSNNLIVNYTPRNGSN
jgi:predicted Zn-dependent peptidase